MALSRFILLSAVAHAALATLALGPPHRAGRSAAAGPLQVSLVKAPEPAPGSRPLAARPLPPPPAPKPERAPRHHAPAQPPVTPIAAIRPRLHRPAPRPHATAPDSARRNRRRVARRSPPPPAPPHPAPTPPASPPPAQPAAAETVANAAKVSRTLHPLRNDRPGAAPAAARAQPAAAPPLSRFGAPGGPRLVQLAYPQYPPRARRRGREGTVILRLRIDAQGRLREATVARSGGEDFDRAALTAVRHSRFGPARRGGGAVVSTAELAVEFRLR